MVLLDMRATTGQGLGKHKPEATEPRRGTQQTSLIHIHIHMHHHPGNYRVAAGLSSHLDPDLVDGLDHPIVATPPTRPDRVPTPRSATGFCSDAQLPEPK